MSDYINTVTIAPQESAAALAQALSDAVGTALGWTTDGLSSWQDESKDGLRALFTVSGAVIKAMGANATITPSNALALGYTANTSYCVDYIKMDDIIAVGVRKADAAVNLPVVFAKNTGGEWKAITVYNNLSAYYIAKSYSAAKSVTLTIVSDTTASTSVALMPDIFGGCLFSNLYLMISCPYDGTDKLFSMGGKTFRYIGTGKAGFAAVVG